MGKEAEKDWSRVEESAGRGLKGPEGESKNPASKAQAESPRSSEAPGPAEEEGKGAPKESQQAVMEEKGRTPAEKEGGKAEEQAAEEGVPSPWEKDLAVYPLRNPQDDPRWAIRTVRIWIGFALASLVFILTLLVLGAIYD